MISPSLSCIILCIDGMNVFEIDSITSMPLILYFMTLEVCCATCLNACGYKGMATVPPNGHANGGWPGRVPV